MAPPPNTTAATATVMTMPYSASLDVSEAPDALHTVWFAYTPAEDECEIGFWAFADLAGTYAPATTVYSGTPSTLTLPHSSLQNVVNRPMQVPVTHGTTYYFEVEASVSGAVSTLLQVSLVAADNLATSVSSIAINDDRSGFPMAIFSATTGGPQQYRPFPAGESVSMLTTGVSLWSDRNGDVLQLYSATLEHLTSPSWVFEGDAPITSNRTGTFYVADSGVAAGLRRVTTISATGVLGPTVWLLPEPTVTLYAIAVSLDDEVLYYYEQGGTATSEIKRFDLVANTPLSSFAADVSGYQSRKDLLVLLDDTVLVGYWKPSPTDSFVRHYARNGSLLHTYPLGDLQLNRLSFALDDPASFWTWSNIVTAPLGRSRFQNIRISDGGILTTFDTVKFEFGISQEPVTATPTARFGHSQSCAFVVFPFTVPPCGENGHGAPEPEPPLVAPSYHLDARYIRRLRRAPHVANENLRVFYRRFELDLERGQGLATGQGSDPMVLLRISRDGGQTWGEEQRMAAGRLGDYTQRVMARRLGQARDTVFEVVVSDPIAWSLVGAWLDLEAGTS